VKPVMKSVLWGAAVLLAILAIAVVVTHPAALRKLFGLDNLSGPWYGFWSGAGSDLTELAIIGGLISLARRHNCHVKGCWRIGRHKVEGTEFITCAKHHPTVPDGGPSSDEVRRAYESARPGRLTAGGVRGSDHP
jgi:hypothetical protein